MTDRLNECVVLMLAEELHDCWAKASLTIMETPWALIPENHSYKMRFIRMAKLMLDRFDLIAKERKE